MAQTNVNFRIDSGLKNDFAELCEDIGISVSAALTLVMKQSVRCGEIPVKLSRDIPNEATLKAMQETEDILSGKLKVKSYTDVDELMADLLKDDEEDDDEISG